MSTDSAAARQIDLDPLVHAKEKLYFGISVIFSLAVYVFLAVTILGSAETAGVVIVYGIIFVIGYLIVHGLFIGHVRGNGIRVSERQFPELKAMADTHARRLGMEETPAIFVLQAGGVLNAFATRFLGRNFVVLFSDVLALATVKGEKAVSFVLGHELGHIHRKHMTKRALLFPRWRFHFSAAHTREGASTPVTGTEARSSPKPGWTDCSFSPRAAISTRRSTQRNSPAKGRPRLDSL